MGVGAKGKVWQLVRWKAMAQRLQVPKFESEADEARWWFEHREDVADEFELAEREGRLGRGTVSSRLSLGASVPSAAEAASKKRFALRRD
jgi:hypothetical protein